MRNLFLLVAFILTTFSQIFSQKKAEWKTEDPHGPSSEVEFTVTEGTWMNLDVSPDGKEIIFDLLGDIYSLPVTGGTAKPLATGLPYEVHPRFSPDGKNISFTSDRGGGDNIWVMNRDGSDKKQITQEDFRLVNNAAWTPDGQYLVAKKHFTSTRSLGSGEIWLWHITGGSGQQLTRKKDDQLDVGEPWVSPDGRYVYFSEDMSGGPVFEYNKDPHGVIYHIRRYDRVEGKLESIIASQGGAVRPQTSPDGKLLAFVKRVRQQTVLYLHDLKTGEEWPIYDKLNKDQQETWATFGVYPGFNWTPDGKNIIIWGEKGHFWKINTETRQATEIPFTVNVKQTLVEPVKFKQEVCGKEFQTKMLRHTTTSPDGKTVAFNAMGQIWVKKMPKGKAERMTTANEHEFYPSFSPNGGKIAYASWSDAEMGAIKIHDLKGGTALKITSEKGYYHNPTFSPDGNWLVFEKGGGTSVLGNAFSNETGIYLCKADGSGLKMLRDNGGSPRFNAKGDRIYFSSREGKNKALKSCDLNGMDERTHFTSQYATDILPSPDDQWVAFRELYKVYVAPFPKSGNAVDLSGGMRNFPVYKVTRDMGDYLHWSGDSKTLHWTTGPEYFSRDLKNCFTFVEGAPDSLPAIDTTGVNIGFSVPYDVPKGTVIIKNARIITMKGDEVIEDGTIVIKDNKIEAIGKSGEVKVPGNGFVIDAKGKTIMPGIVDVHAHLGNSYNGISPQQQWSYYANLAYGVTTSHDPSSNTEMVFSQSEMQKAGLMKGPRIYSTGTILYGAEGDFKAVINNLDDARGHLRRMKAVGAFSVKSYNQPRRNQRQQVIQAARENQMMVYPEGGSFFFHNMSQILDGHTGIEHSIPVSPVYQDVAQLWGKSKVGYTPTLIVGYGGIWGENYWYQKTEVWKNERLLKYYPRAMLDSRSMRRMMIPDEDFGHFQNAAGAKAVIDAGGRVQLGAHGQLHGLGAHWEMWMFEQGGFSELEAIRAATLWGAEYIGMDSEIGSLEPGKLADLIIMDKNPLENIRNSEFISTVIQNGRVYDAETMNEIGNYDVKRAPFFWESAKGSDAFPWHEDTGSMMEMKCGCHGHTNHVH
ncbi:MAG: PD40 domain-containing protein [Bacteroidia bacterium]|nr:PD40 domain-containing protein [Bacteroidia bacterium]